MTSAPKFAPIAPVLRRERIVEELRRAILAGHIPPGAQIIESRIALEFGVSRTLLREALRELIESGLVRNRPYAGNFVAEIDADLLSDVYEVRRIMEAQAYRRVWPIRDVFYRDEMQRRFDAMIEAVNSGNLHEKIRAESHFHGLVYEQCGNHLMPRFWQQMTQKLQLAFGICQIAEVSKMDFRKNHARFLELAIGDDLEAMLEELDAHLQRGLATIQTALQRADSRK